MIKTVSSLILITALLLSCCSSLKVRKRNSVEQATNWNESKDSCPPGYQCLLKEKTKSSALPLKLYKNKGTKNFNILHGNLIDFSGEHIAGSWSLVINQSQYGLGMVYFSQFDLEVDLIAQPQHGQPDYKAVGIDQHLQAISKFSYYFQDDVDVTGYAVLDDYTPTPLFKLEFYTQSLVGDFYLNHYSLTRASVGDLEMKFDKVDKYQGTIKLLQDGPFRDALCLLKFEYQNQYGPGIDQFEVTPQCASSQEDSDQSQGEQEGSNGANPQQQQLAKMYAKLMLKMDGDTSSDKKKQVLKMVKISENYEKLVYGLRIDFE